MATEKFPLICWEETEEFKNLCTKERARLDQLNQEWTRRGGQRTSSSSMQCDKDGQFEFWLNDNAPLCRRDLSLDQAIVLARRHGDCGWWKIQALADLLEGKGPIFESAMWDNGFRRHKNQPNKWVRSKRNEKSPNRFVEPVYDKIVPEDAEGERLRRLILLPNEEFNYGDTFSFIVGESGLMHCYFNVNPFGGTSAETMPAWFSGYSVRAHINKDQGEFSIAARNVLIGEEKYIHILTTGNGAVKECLWPTIVKANRLVEVARHLVSGKP